MPGLARAHLRPPCLARWAAFAPLGQPVSVRLALRPRDAWRLGHARPASSGDGARGDDDAKKLGRAAVDRDKQPPVPERLIIYHAGTGRTAFLAMLKLTTLFVGAFFCLVAVPSYVKADEPTPATVGLALCGVAPFAFVASTSAPFVTHMHIHLPASARLSRAALQRFVAAMPPSTPLTVTTMSPIGKPRYSSLAAADLRPAPRRRRRFGLVNYVRDTTSENAARKWYNLRAVGSFYVQDTAVAKPLGAKRYQTGRKAAVDAWIWDAVREKIASRAAAAPSKPKP